MLNKIRTKHSRKILWALTVIIVISFTLWGGVSFFQKKGEQILGKIGNQKITSLDFSYYYKMAQVNFLLFFSEEQQKKITSQEITNQGWQYLLLLSKIKNEKLTVTDQEVIQIIKKMFSSEKEGFNKEAYLRFIKYRLQIEPRVFEEYARNFLAIDKLFEKYAAVQVSDEQVKDKYIKDTQKARIAYIYAPYEKFNDEIIIANEEIEKFYADNQQLFKEETQEQIPSLEEIKDKVTARIKEEKTKNKAFEFCQEILKKMKEEKSIDLKKFAREEKLESYKETDYFKYDDYIEGVGMGKDISADIFPLDKDQIYQEPFLLAKGAYLIKLIDKTAFDENDFQEKKKSFYDTLYQQMSYSARIKFIYELQKQAKLEIFTPANKEK